MPVGRWVMRIADSVLLTNGGVLRVHGLPAWAGGTVHVDLQVLGADLEVDLLRLREDRHRGRGGVDPAAGLGHRDALDPVHAGLALQP